jgi:Ser/Thr protein kinase RdoA (MazF antagonist)
VPRVRATREGDLFHEAEAEDGRRSIVRLVSYLPGELLDDAAPHPALAREVGAMTARLARALRGFSHPASRHALLWDLTQAPQLRSRTHHIESARRRRIVEEVLDRFAADVLPRLQQQRAQVIHNDVSRMNALVEGHRVNGVIDFGDMIHAPLVSDLAVPISELLVDHPEPIATAAEITAGYHAVTPLTDEELRLIFDLAATRCAVSVAVADWRVRGHPENTAYIMAGVEGTATLLEQMREWGAERMVAALRRACAVPVRSDASHSGTHRSPRGRGRRSRG